jgi:hypothetical protein
MLFDVINAFSTMLLIDLLIHLCSGSKEMLGADQDALPHRSAFRLGFLLNKSITLTELRHTGNPGTKARHRGRRCNSNRLRTRMSMVRFRLAESTTAASTSTTSAATTTTATATATVAATVRTYTATHSLGGDTGSDFDIRFFDNETAFDGATTGAAIFGREHPFVIGFGQSINGNDADAIAIVAALTRAETDTPFGLTGFG